MAADDAPGWFAFIKSRWWAADWGWTEEAGVYHISTGGWSGNEALIAAMRDNVPLWWATWESARRGGHYEFRVREKRAGKGPGERGRDR